MPDLLRKIPFTEELLSVVQDFACGDETWELPLARWIKAAPSVKNGALGQMRKSKGKLEVWLHVNEADEVVGYSSLGQSNWEWPSANDPRVPISVIPYVAIQEQFWGQPKADPPRYSRQILDHLIFEAAKHVERHPLLGLFVDPRNTRAISAYKKAGFEEYFRAFLDDGIEYRSMLLKLSKPLHPSAVE
jgi:ribosomal protein S18 acetylase RimI-like enzyme